MNHSCLAAQGRGSRKQISAENGEWLTVSAQVGEDEKVQDADKNISAWWGHRFRLERGRSPGEG